MKLKLIQTSRSMKNKRMCFNLVIRKSDNIFSLIQPLLLSRLRVKYGSQVNKTIGGGSGYYIYIPFMFWRTPVLFMVPLVFLFRTSANICSAIKSQGGFPYQNALLPDKDDPERHFLYYIHRTSWLLGIRLLTVWTRLLTRPQSCGLSTKWGKISKFKQFGPLWAFKTLYRSIMRCQLALCE